MITLRTSDKRLCHACRAVEDACTAVQPDGQWDVDVLADFDHFVAQGHGTAIKTTPAAYHVRENKILVNEAHVFALAEADLVAVLVHEVGHAHLHLLGPPEDCFAADLFACRAGQHATLAKIRDADARYGSSYVALLDLWETPAIAKENYLVWRNAKMIA